jgi:crossover junction endodeoxyribonuclease RuvC
MIILGIDPGTLITGFSVLQVEKSRCAMLVCDIVKNSAKQSMPIRLKRIYDGLCEIIDKYHPDEFAIETAFYSKNAQSALKIGLARGVSILAAVNHQIPTAEYSPREVKKAVTGNGAASKQQVQFMLKKQLALNEMPKSLDASDALAVALCHSFRISRSKIIASHSQKSRSWSTYVDLHPERVVRKK